MTKNESPTLALALTLTLTAWRGTTQLVTDLGAIRRNYLTSWFPLDLFTVLPVDIASRMSQNQFPCRCVNVKRPDSSRETLARK